MTPQYPQFETERLRLIPTSIDDASFILALLNTPNWIRHIGDRKVTTIEEAVSYIQNKMNPQLERLGFGNFTVSLKSTEEKIGICGLYDRAGLKGFDIGFAFLPPFEKQGYAFESAQVIRDAAFNQLGIKEISAITKEANIDSQKLLIKLGLRFEKKFFMVGDKEELMLFRLKDI
jgi:[ribosomal protein S5]-alanine N-acetyltransferase